MSPEGTELGGGNGGWVESGELRRRSVPIRGGIIWGGSGGGENINEEEEKPGQDHLTLPAPLGLIERGSSSSSTAWCLWFVAPMISLPLLPCCSLSGVYPRIPVLCIYTSPGTMRIHTPSALFGQQGTHHSQWWPRGA